VGELGIPVADQESECADAVVEVYGEVPGCLRGPSAGGVGGDAEDVDSADMDLDDEQHVKSAQEDRVEVKEIAGQQPVGLGAKERSPGRVEASRWRADAVAAQNSTDGRLADAIAQPDELALYPPVSPPGALSRQL
jgi:hypothetical protein